LKTNGVGDNLVEFNAVTSVGDKWDGKQITDVRDRFSTVRASLQTKAFRLAQDRLDVELGRLCNGCRGARDAIKLGSTTTSAN
jgi:hypothetical protein